MRRAGLIALVILAASLVPMTAPAPVLAPIDFNRIAGWADAQLDGSLAAFRLSCAEIIGTGHAFERSIRFGGNHEDWLAVCRAAKDADEPRKFFETHFEPLAVTDPDRPEGLFTGYYEPEAPGSLAPSPDHPAAMYGKPDDLLAFSEEVREQTGLSYGRLIDGEPAAYFSRREIEEGALRGRGLELAWLEDWVDAFFIQVQGSGRVRLADGRIIRLAYAAKSGQPYIGIGGVLVERGVLTRETMSMQSLRKWMAEHPAEARELMWENKSFVFFRAVEVEDPALGPPGAQKVNLTPKVSLAVDRSLWAFGTPVWLETEAPAGEAAILKSFRTLMIAQDTGTAIKGHARGDVFWGAGPEAALTAGHMKSPGRMIVLLPKPLARRLLADQ